MSESVQAIPPFINTQQTQARRDARPTAKQWATHVLLFLLTVGSTTLAGIINAAPIPDVPEPPMYGVIDAIFYIPRYYFLTIVTYLGIAFTQPAILAEGLIFSAALLAILTAHELGHYIACRRYGVAATLPFFIPAPPLFLAGTFGAFIKIKSPIPSRRALFDIGLAGPLAGFVVAVPVAVIGVMQMEPGVPWSGYGIIFQDPLLFRLIAWIIGQPLDMFAPINPYYMAAWIGLLVTSLNLMPVGQLDGGHGTFAVFGQRAHSFIGRVAFVTMAMLTVLGYLWYNSPSGFLYTVLLLVMLKVRHPQPVQMEPLGRGRIWIAVITLMVFALCFWPFPITISLQ